MDKVEKDIMDNAIGLSKSIYGPKDVRVCIYLTISFKESVDVQPTLHLFGASLEEYVEWLYDNYKRGKYETKK